MDLIGITSFLKIQYLLLDIYTVSVSHDTVEATVVLRRNLIKKTNVVQFTPVHLADGQQCVCVCVYVS